MTTGLILFPLEFRNGSDGCTKLRGASNFSEGWEKAISLAEMQGYTSGFTVPDRIEPFRKAADVSGADGTPDGYVSADEAKAFMARNPNIGECPDFLEIPEQKLVLQQCKSYLEKQKEYAEAQYDRDTEQYFAEVQVGREYKQYELDEMYETKVSQLAQIEKDLAEVNKVLNSL